jgi:alpha 1,3-glucosidase
LGTRLTTSRGGDGNFDEPYRLYNLDVFEYIMDSPMALYGAIPLMQAHKKDSTVAVFWLNAAETWIDIVKSKSAVNSMSMGLAGTTDTQTHWFSESGLLDIFVMLGPGPADIAKTYGDLTGYTAMPPIFGTAYHQCRWNYVTDEDVKDVDRKFDRSDIPYDVIWLDIEYTDGKKYFTWDPLTFSDPIGMEKQLDVHDRKLVTIIDPHIKNEGGYEVVDQMKSKNLAANDKSGSLYEGWCWPGSSHWIDAFNPAAIAWWKTLFTYKFFKGTQSNVWIWNDMNEPSVFNGPETTMPKDNLHHSNWEHRDIHNLNGLTFNNATYEALLVRDGSSTPATTLRPFVLTRSFFAGSQRMGAMWTGDNQADWPHLEASLPMILAQGISGYPFSGADVGGFFGNPSKELFTRWYQAGAFYPFFRGHAHIDTRRREPYLAGEPYTGIITQSLRLRYALLPAWYTAFHTAHLSGAPIVRPNWYVHPADTAGFAIDDQMYLADTGLLVKPVTAEGATSVSIYLANAATYYDYFDYTAYSGAAGRSVTIDAPLDKLPLLMQAGHIIPRRERPRRSSGLMKWDPYTLVVVLDSANASATAEGELYMDDGNTYAYTEGAYIWRRFVFADNTLRSEDLHDGKGKSRDSYAKEIESVTVEKIVVVGAPSKWAGEKDVKVSGEGTKGAKAELVFHEAQGGKAAWAVVRKPDVLVGSGWKVEFGA